MNAQQIMTLLQKHAINVACFGTGSAKSLENLLAEIESGEAVLVEGNSRLARKISVLGVDVFIDIGGTKIRLVEDRQVFNDGRVRRRSLPSSISEKLHQGEDVLEAVARALNEEIGISTFTLLTPTPRTRVEIEDSPSYPGILSEYTKHEVDVLIASSEYKAEGYREVQPDKTTHFVWAVTNRSKS
ncbi:MAG: NUDIX domain-containing protein [bacterium]|nr:NUDIX domain-containing protein [bacterium]